MERPFSGHLLLRVQHLHVVPARTGVGESRLFRRKSHHNLPQMQLHQSCDHLLIIHRAFLRQAVQTE